MLCRHLQHLCHTVPNAAVEIFFFSLHQYQKVYLFFPPVSSSNWSEFIIQYQHYELENMCPVKFRKMILILLGCSHKLKSLFYFQTSFCAVEGLLSCKPCETREFYPFRFSLPLISERNVK